MKYDKPEVTVVDLALHAVRGGKAITHVVDSSFEMTTSGAYEADE